MPFGTPEDHECLPHRRLRVAIVDDSAVALRGICSVIKAFLGFEIVGAETWGGAGLTLTETIQPDLVLLDLQMPDLSCTEIAERLTRQGEEGDERNRHSHVVLDLE